MPEHECDCVDHGGPPEHDGAARASSTGVDRRRFLKGLGVVGALGVAGGLGSSVAERVAAGAATGGRRAAVGGVGPPVIVTRAQWGADEKLRDGARVFAPVRKLVVHHTVTMNNPRDPAGFVRGIYRTHTQDRGYVDIAYNFLIDAQGRIYEGRWARDYPAGAVHDGENPFGLGVVGAHATDVNTGSCGVALIGDFSTGAPTQAALAALIDLLVWKCAKHAIDPLGADRFVPIEGKPSTFPNIVGHGSIGSTECPGKGLATQLPAVRNAVAARTGRFPARTVDLAAATVYTGGASRSSINAVRPTTTTTKAPARPATTSGSRSPLSASSAPPPAPIARR
jgi:hypothetical protein